ncbi:histone-lysine N-methyltransferase SETMAR [Plakobranchus ocellatus]|uniref:Histone-lysine N-methyltransferase SETMAR n=1 Tax=Plakobranchus ocellatus TaxID=259542 RepID=A0AAV4DQ04_9GAST|nr:histone-lysine N-methyltransferase SETMAR [Plakobranchus ocellatus]
MSRCRVYKWCTWFGEGRTSLGDEPKFGRPKTSTNEENTTRVDELIRCDRRMKIREIALKPEIPKSTVHEIVHDTLGYRKVSARWVPKMLTEDHKLQRVEISQHLLQRCQQDNVDEDTTHIGVGPGGDFQANNNLFDNLITENSSSRGINNCTHHAKQQQQNKRKDSGGIRARLKDTEIIQNYVRDLLTQFEPAVCYKSPAPLPETGLRLVTFASDYCEDKQVYSRFNIIRIYLLPAECWREK